MTPIIIVSYPPEQSPPQIHQQLIIEGKVSGAYDSGVADIYAEKVLDAEKHELVRVAGA